MRELERAFNRLEVNSRFGLRVTMAERHCLVLDCNLTISSLNTVDDDFALALVGGVPDRLLLGKDEHAGLVVVKDRHSRARVLANQPTPGRLIVQLNVKVLIRFPSFVVNNLNFNFSLALAILKGDLFINWSIVLISSGISIDSSDIDDASSLTFVRNFNPEGTCSFTD